MAGLAGMITSRRDEIVLRRYRPILCICSLLGSAIIVAIIGAVILLLIVALFTKGLPRRRYWRWRL
jgi:hypothetical protein